MNYTYEIVCLCSDIMGFTITSWHQPVQEVVYTPVDDL